MTAAGFQSAHGDEGNTAPRAGFGHSAFAAEQSVVLPWRCTNRPTTAIVTGGLRVESSGDDRTTPTAWVALQPLATDGEPLGTALRCGPVSVGPTHRIRWRVAVPAETQAIRLQLDPPQSAWTLRAAGLRLRRESRIGRALASAARAAALFWKSPAGLAADLDRLVAKKTLTGGLGGAAPDFVPQCRPLAARVDAALSGSIPTVNVLIPSLRREHLSGGPNTALNLAARLAARGVPVRCLSTDWPCEAETAWLDRHLCDLVGRSSLPDNWSWHSAHDAGRPVSIGPHDILLATAWWTAQQARPLLQSQPGLRLWYLIQDYEPGLYAWSSQAALASETYTWPALPIFCGHLLRDHFRQERIGPFARRDHAVPLEAVTHDDADTANDAGATAGLPSNANNVPQRHPPLVDASLHQHLVFEPAVDQRLFHAHSHSISRSGRRRFVFYARPSAPRNLYELGLVALKRAVDRGAFRDHWELWFIGEQIPAVDLGHGVTIRPAPWADYAAYAAFLRETDVGLSLMLSPHPSYPPLELAACGAHVVTNTFGVKTAERLRALAPQIMAVSPEIDALANALVNAAGQVNPDLGSTAGEGIGPGIPRDWETSFAPVLDGLINDWRGQVAIRRAA